MEFCEFSRGRGRSFAFVNYKVLFDEDEASIELSVVVLTNTQLHSTIFNMKLICAVRLHRQAERVWTVCEILGSGNLK